MPWSGEAERDRRPHLERGGAGPAREAREAREAPPAGAADAAGAGGLSEQPELLTARLVLRPFRLRDAEAVRELAGDRAIALNTLNVPHPYERSHAEDWIASQPSQFRRREAVTYAVVARVDHGLVGAVGLILDLSNRQAELGYWIGRPYWGHGYATEAARGLMGWAFPALELNRIHASHFPRNPASGAVLRKLGMRHEGCLRQAVLKWGEFLDLERYGLLRSEWETAGPGGGEGVV